MDASCPSSGLAWFLVPGYNNDAAFDAYVDTVDNVRVLLFHHESYNGCVSNVHPTANNAASGTPGWSNSYRLANAGTLLTSMCPSSTDSTFIVVPNCSGG